MSIQTEKVSQEETLSSPATHPYYILLLISVAYSSTIGGMLEHDLKHASLIAMVSLLEIYRIGCSTIVGTGTNVAFIQILK